jgi:hypothetical protein
MAKRKSTIKPKFLRYKQQNEDYYKILKFFLKGFYTNLRRHKGSDTIEVEKEAAFYPAVRNFLNLDATMTAIYLYDNDEIDFTALERAIKKETRWVENV